jgi:hypothetical protein
MIYFLQIDGGPIKIGFSNAVDRRQLELESHYGRSAVLLGIMEGGRDEETSIHRRFSHLRLGRKEQFKPTAELMAFIGVPLLVDVNPESVEAVEPTRLSGTKPVRLDLSEETHRRLRVVAAEEAKSMAEWARDLVDQVVNERYEGRLKK